MFFVDEPVLMVPKLYVNLPTCLLRVVDNDSGEELTRVFQKVAPNNLKKNKVEETNHTEHAITDIFSTPGELSYRMPRRPSTTKERIQPLLTYNTVFTSTELEG